MNIKNNKGVTLTILVLTIVVMLILFGITFSSATELLKNSQKNKMKTMLYMVKSRAEILLDDFLFDNDGKNKDVLKSTSESLKGINSTDGEISYVGYIKSDNCIYKSWNEDILKKQGIDTKNLAQGDKIIIQYNIDTGEVDVASTKGILVEGQSLHILKDFD